MEEKRHRVAKYAKGIVKDLEVIAHSVGVPEPRLMRPYHVRIVQPNGTSIPLDALTATARENANVTDAGTKPR